MLSYIHVSLLTLLQKSSELRYDEILASYNDSILNDIMLEIIDKMNKFYPFYSGETNRLTDNFEIFKELTDIDKFNIIEQLLNLLHASSTLSKLNFGSIKTNSFGRKPHSINMEGNNLVYQSITGLYESRIHID